MDMVIRVKGITARWLVNVLAVVFAIVLVVEIAFAFFFYNYYYNQVSETASNYSKDFYILNLVGSDISDEEFKSKAMAYVQEFKNKNKIEIQIIDRYGEVFVTSTGFDAAPEKMPDYDSASISPNGTGRWNGSNASGEKIMAGTTMLAGGNGALRWVVSMEQVNQHIVMVVIITVTIGVAVILLAMVSGMYFIKSIVKPVQAVSNVARRIALGDLKARIDVHENNEIGELCDSINYMASELSEAENIKQEFISSVSHELRTPLTAIRGWGETVKISVGSDDELVHRGIDVILTESERLSGLVEELLDFSRMQSGRLSMHMLKTDLLAELLEAVRMYEDHARRQGIELVFVSPESLTPVMGDDDRLKQVFINIIDNAIKYTESGGQVLIEAAEEEGCIRITVKDTGVGIPATDVDRVKEKFFKSNKTVRGSGIGLAVADEIVKHHKGLLLLESKEGVGTTVTVVFPVMQSDETVKEDALPVKEYLHEDNMGDDSPAAVIDEDAITDTAENGENQESIKETDI